MTEQQLSAMRLALEALEECRRDPRLKYEHPFYDKAITAIRTAIEQAEKQEPFVWLEDDKGNKYPMPEKNKGSLLKRAEEAFESAKKREWVGLTESDIKEIWLREETTYAALKMIEAKLKEKIMDKQDIIRMAREAGLYSGEPRTPSTGRMIEKRLERFAALVAAAERNRTWTQAHWTEYERSIAAAERQRIVNLLMIQHEMAKGRHNYWHVAANLIQAEVASDT